jgi:type VI secretion system protein ImpC
MSAKESRSEAVVQTTETASDFMDQVYKATKSRSEESITRTRTLVETLAGELAKGITVGKDSLKTIKLRIAEIDRLLSLQLNEIMHHEDFQKLEASWRGLQYLVKNSTTGKDMKIRVLNASKKDLLKEFDNASEFDQDALFKKVYEEEYGMFGGAPYGALIGDYEFGISQQDMALLSRISNVAAAAHAPFIAAAGPSLFGYDSFTELGDTRDLNSIFERKEAGYIKWRAFRKSADSRYVGLTLPHTLGRLPYGPEDNPTEAFVFREDVDGTDHDKYLWCNAAYAFGARITSAFAETGWLANIRGVENGGLVEDLPTHTFPTDDGDVALKCPTEIAITERREKELSEQGFIPLVHCKGKDYAAFFAAQSTQDAQAATYSTDAAKANARLSTMLQYMLCVSRFAHFLKVMARDKIGSPMERAECERWLNKWINNYVVANPNDVSDEVKAKRPLQDARIEVQEVKGKPGCYEAVAFLRPHLQLEELTVDLCLVAELPAAAGS